MSPLAYRYGLTYGRHPRKAAQALQRARRHAQEARQAGDQAVAEEYEEIGDALEAILAKNERCRRCGRELRHPASIAAGIGPECSERA